MPTAPVNMRHSTRGAITAAKRSGRRNTRPLFTSRNVRLRGTGERRIRSLHGPASPRRSGSGDSMRPRALPPGASG